MIAIAILLIPLFFLVSLAVVFVDTVIRVRRGLRPRITPVPPSGRVGIGFGIIFGRHH